MRKSMLLVLSLCCLFILMTVVVWIFLLPASNKKISNNTILVPHTIDSEEKNASKTETFIRQNNQENLKSSDSLANHTRQNFQNHLETQKDELDIGNIATSIQIDKQTFNISSANITTLTSTQGTRLVINPFDLITIDGKPVTGNITVTLKEYNDKHDMLRANMQTASDGKLLVSGGAYFLELTANNSILQLKEGRTMEAYFPGIDQPGMQLFYGARNQQGSMNWLNENLFASFDDVGSPKFKRFYTSEDWRFRTFQILITRSGVSFFAEGARGFKIGRWKYDMNAEVKNMIKEQIKNAKFSPRSYWDCEDVGGYYFFTDNCEIMLEADVYDKGISALDTEDFNVLKSKIEDYYAKSKANKQQNKMVSEWIAKSGLTKFGWINCDRFYSDTATRKDLMVTLEYPDDILSGSTAVFMVFKNLNSVLNGNYTSYSDYSFANIPSDEEVSVIAICRSEGKILVGKSSSFKLTDLQACKIKLTQINVEELDPLINSL